MVQKKDIVGLALLLLFFATACQNEVYTPKPRGYYRISVKDTSYKLFSDIAPFSFEYSAWAYVDTIQRPNEKYWMNLVYPKQNAVVFITYKSLKSDNLEDCVNDSRTMAYKQISKADDIQVHTIFDTASAVYGNIYEIFGNEAACPYQFWITDKQKHFFRASLYFNCTPQNDSLAPIINHLKKDMLHLIGTFAWKKE
jgi:gliding motility-associated lipoprotein GldD